MTRSVTAGLAVARLTEASPAHAPRREAGRPMQGYCLITCDPDFSRVTLYVENGQTLTDRSGAGGFYYEGWLVGPAGAMSLGAFNVGPDGHGGATRTVTPLQAQPGHAELVRVTVEPFGGTETGAVSVLEGRLIWLDAGAELSQAGPGDWPSRAEAAGLSAPVPAGPAWSAGPAVDGTPDAPSDNVGSADIADDQLTADVPDGLARQFGADTPAGLGFGPAAASAGGFGKPAVTAPGGQPVTQPVGIGTPGTALAGESSDPSAPAALADAPATEAELQPGAAPDLAMEHEPDSGSQPFPAPGQPETVAGMPADQDGAFIPAASAPAPDQAQPALGRVNPLNVQVQLVQRHPMTPRASGTANLNLRRGTMSLTLRGLPSPMALGRDRTTGRPFNAYRVWLVNQRSQIRTPVGYCERAWGENFRFVAEGLPLNRNDTILITAEDRSAATSTGHAAPQVLIGSYEP